MRTKYEVYVDDNFHYMDESERFKLENSKPARKQQASARESMMNSLNKDMRKE